MSNLPKKEAWEAIKEEQEKAYGETDSSKEFARAEHQARNDAVGTDFEVRQAKEETFSSSYDKSNSSQNNDHDDSDDDDDDGDDDD